METHPLSVVDKSPLHSKPPSPGLAGANESKRLFTSARGADLLPAFTISYTRRHGQQVVYELGVGISSRMCVHLGYPRIPAEGGVA